MNVRILWIRVMECMCAQTRHRFILSSERVFFFFFLGGGGGWNGVRTHVYCKGKFPSTRSLEEERTHDAASRRTVSPTQYRLSYSGPHFRSIYTCNFVQSRGIHAGYETHKQATENNNHSWYFLFYQTTTPSLPLSALLSPPLPPLPPPPTKQVAEATLILSGIGTPNHLNFSTCIIWYEAECFDMSLANRHFTYSYYNICFIYQCALSPVQ